ncbi:hypothetical protein C487_17040 [Natrinema pallidum DSM 3751]|uniref:Uncharacterized protein n=1 Tax=Natrinema pallidum DSM 3751 TaxID=1227495 RepID=L9YKP8_9EURY|nr:hypothetical protein C487_17040 [Natrinema pallidum DSM 3751]
MTGESILGRLIPQFWSSIGFRNSIRNEYKQMRSSLRHDNTIQVPFDFPDRGHRLGDKAEDVHLEVIRAIEKASSDSEEILGRTQSVEHTIPENRTEDVQAEIARAIRAIDRQNWKSRGWWALFVLILLLVVSATIILPQLLA